METLFDLMDLPENLQRGLYVIRPIRGAAAAIMAAVLLFLCWLIWPWLWFFDVESTAQWTAIALETLSPTLQNAGIPLSATYRDNISWIVTGTTFLPTLIELFTVRFASAGIKAARILVLFFASFDLLTDWPRVSQFVDAFGVTAVGGLLSFVLKIALLLLASFGLQVLFIVFAVCGFVALMNARSRPGTREAARDSRAGSFDV